MSDRTAPPAPTLDVNELPEIRARDRLHEEALSRVHVDTWTEVREQVCLSCGAWPHASWLRSSSITKPNGSTITGYVVALRCLACGWTVRTQFHHNETP